MASLGLARKLDFATSKGLERRGCHSFKLGGRQELSLNLLLSKLTGVKFNKISKFRLVKCMKGSSTM